MTPIHAAWLGFGSSLIYATMALLKSGAVGLPKNVVPWLALLLGTVGGAATALQGGGDWPTVLTTAVEGLLSGALAIAGHETMGSIKGNKLPPGQEPDVKLEH